MDEAMVTMGVPMDLLKMILSLNALIVAMARIRGWKLSSEI
jgi:hypothetical protein